MRKEPAVGFYWTLPVPWAGFTTLPSDVDAAAARSRTVRYQRDRVRRWAAEEGRDLVSEQVFLELMPDRGSAHGAAALEKIFQLCRETGAELVMVDFASAYGWRIHPWIRDAIRAANVPVLWLEPDEILIDGQLFDPVAHFRTWRAIEDARAAEKPARIAMLQQTIGDLATEHATNAAIADALNADGLTTPTGKPWTAENVRKFRKGM